MCQRILSTSISMLCGFSLYAQTIHLEISGIKNPEGQICVAFFNSKEAFKKEKPLLEVIYNKQTRMKNGRIEDNVVLKPGIYGISVLDDEDSNGRMRFNLIGIPQEGFGFGNFEIKGLKKPAFDKFSFEIKAGESKTIRVMMQYL